MKTAVIYSGQARTFTEVFPNQYWQVLRKLPNPEFFVSVADDVQAASMTRLWERFPQESVHIEYVQQPQIEEPPPNPKWLALYPPSSPPQAILRQLWSLDRAWAFYRESRTSDEHEIVVRIRPDIAFARCDLPRLPLYRECHTPWWARWGGVNDRFSVMRWTAAEHYFTTLQKRVALWAAGCPLHPETMIAASLEEGGVDVSHTLATEFVTVRLDGTHVAPSITVVDQVEYARTRT